MSKASMSIVFENSKRIFHGGDCIRGVVYVAAHTNMHCKSLRLTGLWRTHGRGNRATGEYFNEVLAEGEWRAGDQFEFPFEFDAPHRPVTYRGRLLNVDHYVRVRADVPWAFDPKSELDFVVLPSKSAPPAPFNPSKPAAAVQATSRVISTVVAIFMLSIGLILIPVFGLGLILMGIGGAMLFFSMRNSIAEKRLGAIQIGLPERVVGPGHSIPLSVTFVPNRSGRVNRIRATLIGIERVVSGSGTNRRTHTHNLHKSVCDCAGPGEFTRDKPSVHHARLAIPNTRAYSFHAADNSLLWNVSVHVDLPMWPDWKRTETLMVVPPEHLQVPPVRNEEEAGSQATTAEIIAATATEPEIVLATAVIVEAESDPVVSGDDLEAEPTVLAESKIASTAEEPGEEPAEAATEGDAPPTLTEIAGMLAAADRFSDQSDQILEAVEQDVHSVDLEVDRVTSTFGYLDETEFRNGKTVSGNLTGSEQRVSVQLPESWNERASQLYSGDVWNGRARIVGWDHFSERLEMKCVE